MHPNEYLSREVLDTVGVAYGLDGLRRKEDRSIESVPVSYSNRDFVEKFSGFVLSQLVKKEGKAYPPNTTLIVNCTLNMPYFPDEWSELIGRIRRGLPASRFSEIFLHDPLGRYSHTIFPEKCQTDGESLV